MNILVTGATGSIGSAVVRNIKDNPQCAAQLDGAAVYGLAHSEQGLFEHVLAGKTQPDVWVMGDVTMGEATQQALLGGIKADIIIHCAAMKHVGFCEENPSMAEMVNHLGTINMLALAKQWGSKFVLLSTDKAVEPITRMGVTKMKAEKAVSQYEHGCIVRLCNVLDSRGNIMEIFRHQKEKGIPLTVTDPSMLRYWIDSKTAAEVIVRTATDLVRSTVFIEPVAPISVGEMVKALGETLDKVDFIGSRPMEKHTEVLQWRDEEAETWYLGDFHNKILREFDVDRGSIRNKWRAYNCSTGATLACIEEWQKVPGH